ncbi:MAG: hypothetical protein ACREP2_07530 [Rhodanobacteraceae bacterium]
MPRTSKPKAPKTVAALNRKEATRTNIPTAEYQSVMHPCTGVQQTSGRVSDVYAMQEDFAKVVEAGFANMIDATLAGADSCLA